MTKMQTPNGKKAYAKPEITRVSLKPAATSLAECWSLGESGGSNESPGFCQGGTPGCYL